MYIVLSAFTSSPISLLDTTKVSVFLYSMYASSQHINIISTNQKLMCIIYAKPRERGGGGKAKGGEKTNSAVQEWS